MNAEGKSMAVAAQGERDDNARVDAQAQFTDYVCRNMPVNTVIGDPFWWAPRLFNAARAALAAQAQPVAVPDEIADTRHHERYRAGWNACRAAMLAAAPSPQPANTAGDALDAARYRWLRDTANFVRKDAPQVVITDFAGDPVSLNPSAYPQGAALDTAIDAEMAAPHADSGHGGGNG